MSETPRHGRRAAPPRTRRASSAGVRRASSARSGRASSGAGGRSSAGGGQGQALRAADRRRRRRRTWLLWGTAPVWGTVLVLALVLVAGVAVSRGAIVSYEDGRYRQTADRFEVLDGIDLVERWKAPFGLGTARYLDGDLWGALDDLDRALETVPEEHRCAVQTNRALVLEAWGDREMEWSAESAGWAEEAQTLVDAGEPYPDDAPWGVDTPDELRDDARRYAAWAGSDYAAAAEARADPACADDSQASAEQQEQNQESRDRLEGKQQQAAEAAQDPADQEQSDQEQTEQTEEQRQQELEQRNAAAAAQAEAERQEQAGDDEGDGGTKGW